ncbi:LytTR family DNA-binding domain-containing protein [Parasalinivibrio latis]|uniref:LytR/AlgR family response regulator transcription factor n=1 Tax=Parasalinivibrio latis TaxID=2952610 RepID=UPI0030DF6B81
MRVVVADDEPLLRHHIVKLITELSDEIDVVASVGDGNSALMAIDEYQPEAVFLDIRMPGTDGLAVAKELSGRARAGEAVPQIVFITAYDTHAIEAFERGAVDYLVKPVDESRLAQTCERLLSRKRDEAEPSADIASLLECLKTVEKPVLKWLKANKGEDIHVVAVDDVVYFQAEDKYVTVYTEEDTYLIRMPLKSLMAQLDENVFWQIHRAVIVRVSAIKKVTRDFSGRMHVLVSVPSAKLPVSRNGQALFKQM